jgi:hypothetical protein
MSINIAANVSGLGDVAVLKNVRPEPLLIKNTKVEIKN